jgi:hypothetical protein
MEIYTQVISKIYNVNNNIFYANKARVIWTKYVLFYVEYSFSIYNITKIAIS